MGCNNRDNVNAKLDAPSSPYPRPAPRSPQFYYKLADTRDIRMWIYKAKRKHYATKQIW